MEKVYSTNCCLALNVELNVEKFSVEKIEFDTYKSMGIMEFKSVVMDATSFIKIPETHIFAELISAISPCGRYGLTWECGDKNNILDEGKSFLFEKQDHRCNNPVRGYWEVLGGGKKSTCVDLSTCNNMSLLKKNGYWSRPK
jgi:hypothetical protein